MVTKQNTKRVWQSVVMLTEEERELAEKLAEQFKGNMSQVFRLGLFELNQKIQKGENAESN